MSTRTEGFLAEIYEGVSKRFRTES